MHLGGKLIYAWHAGGTACPRPQTMKAALLFELDGLKRWHRLDASSWWFHLGVSIVRIAAHGHSERHVQRSRTGRGHA